MTHVYLSQDSSSRAAGTRQLAPILRAFESTHDFKLIETGSRGAFFLEPMIEVDTAGGRCAYSNVRPDEVEPLLRGGMLQGKPIRDGFFADVEKIPFLANQTRITFARCGRIETGSLRAYQAAGGYAALRTALFNCRPQEIIEQIKRSGLRGRGGAAFPTGIKWQTAADFPADEKFVVANGDEGDPGTYADRMLMEGDPFALLEGMTICARAIGATKGFIYIRAEYPRAAERMRQAIAAAGEAGFLGDDILGSSFSFHVEIRRGAGAYVCGEETALLESLEGRRGMVRPKPPFPATHGLFGKPTVVNNVTTLATIPAILQRGGGWYAAMGTEKSRGTIALQLAGALRTPGLVEVPFGITLRKIIEDFGGGALPGHAIAAVQVGGPLGDLFAPDQLDLPVDFDAFATIGGMLGHGGIVVYDDRTDGLELAERLMTFLAHESCGKCAPCRLGSRHGAEILHDIRAGRGEIGDAGRIADIAVAMRSASLCALGGMAATPIRAAMRLFPKSFAALAR
ncbi:MAG TPA: NADH-ubiquinone oxidoreductase-F iron-sulfur binding region domain-containing protein [Tepidisphaeraceae bacterium]|jgi:formate dehydrogenase iron-sulfur subunit